MTPAPDANQKRGFFARIAPALALMVLAPLIAEILPGATRFGALPVFVVEMTIWGGGAVMIREIVRRRGLGWGSVLLLALALAIAEECLIQQTSFAPLIFYIKGQVWGRAFGVNYIYLLWALLYEAALVVFVPVMLTELLFPARRDARWLNGAGWAAFGLLFAVGSLAAWFLWTHIVREKLHLGIYTPSPVHLIAGAAAIALLVWAGLGRIGKAITASASPSTPPAPWVVGVAGAIWSAAVFVIEILAFGILPTLSPAAGIGGGLAIGAATVTVLPRWTRHPAWSDRHRAWLIAGTMIGMMAVMFQAFVGADPKDLLFKEIVDAVAVVMFVWLVVKVGRRPVA